MFWFFPGPIQSSRFQPCIFLLSPRAISAHRRQVVLIVLFLHNPVHPVNPSFSSLRALRELHVKIFFSVPWRLRAFAGTPFRLFLKSVLISV